ncbi:MAG TPA: hypothetical protein VMU17_05170, partial [Elusimicrobiota bacterium]|nr:hypothetical protein [Elusimicrobiota bacterium]
MSLPLIPSKRAARLLLAAFLWAAPAAIAAADDSDSNTETEYYWKDRQLNNLGRLSTASPDFEKLQRKTRLGGDPDEYLSSIRKQMAHQAEQNSKERATLEYSGQL